MFFRRIVVFCSTVLLPAAFLAGCSDPYAGRMEVAGQVKLQGQPVKNGSILFFPLDSKETQSGAPIVDGEYKIARKDGLKPGRYLVRLTAGDGKTPAADEQVAVPGGSTNIVSVDLIPDDWNVKPKHEIEVKSNNANRFDFDIPNVNTVKRKR
jgi:hypothetical protein